MVMGSVMRERGSARRRGRGVRPRGHRLATGIGSGSRTDDTVGVLAAVAPFSTDSADGFDLERQWARGCWYALAPHRTGAYVNWLMEEGDERVREVYGEERYRRLQAVKRRYDPENVFHLNQNVVPR
jgi:hypothetical protein